MSSELLRSISPSYFIEVTKLCFPSYCNVSDEIKITIRVYVGLPGKVLIEDSVPSFAEIRRLPESSKNIECEVTGEKIIIWLNNEKFDSSIISYSLVFRRSFDGNLGPAIVRIGALTRYSNMPRLRVADSPASVNSGRISGKIPLSSNVESTRTMAQPNYELPELGQIVGHEKAIEELRKSFINPLIKGDCDPSNIVIEGPDGTGKKLLARALIKEIQRSIQVNFKIVSGSELDPEAVRALFDNVTRERESRPSIIVIENIELMRGYAADQSMAVLLSRIAEATFHSRGTHIIVTTSSPRCLPEKFWNAGSFKRVQLERPSEKEIQKLLEKTIERTAASAALRPLLPELSKKLSSHRLSQREVVSIAKAILMEKMARESLGHEDVERIVQSKVLEVRSPYEIPLESMGIPPFTIFVYPEHVMKKIRLVMDRIKNLEGYLKMGLNPGQAIIIKGPPGTGKTTLPLCIAKSCGAKAFRIDSQIVRGIVGESEREIRNIFDSASSSSPAIIIIDEVHQLIPVSQRTEEFTSRVFHTLSTEVENSLHERVTTVATSSASKEISISNFTRLFEVIELPLPSSPEERIEILMRNTDAYGFKVDPNLLKKYAGDDYTPNWSGKELFQLLINASKYAIRDGKRIIDEACLDEAFLNVSEARTNV